MDRPAAFPWQAFGACFFLHRPRFFQWTMQRFRGRPAAFPRQANPCQCMGGCRERSRERSRGKEIVALYLKININSILLDFYFNEQACSVSAAGLQRLTPSKSMPVYGGGCRERSRGKEVGVKSMPVYGGCKERSRRKGYKYGEIYDSV